MELHGGKAPSPTTEQQTICYKLPKITSAKHSKKLVNQVSFTLCSGCQQLLAQLKANDTFRFNDQLLQVFSFQMLEKGQHWQCWNVTKHIRHQLELQHTVIHTISYPYYDSLY